MGGSFSLGLKTYSLTVVGTFESAASTPLAPVSSSLEIDAGFAGLVLREEHRAESIGQQAEDHAGEDDKKQRFGAGFITHGVARLGGN